MSVIAFSNGYSSFRSDFAKRTAEKLRYDYVGRDVVALASQKSGIPETQLSLAIHQSPSFFGMSDEKRIRYLACFLAQAAEFLLSDNLVYNSLASHVIARGISHVMIVRLITPRKARIHFYMERDHLSLEKAEQTVTQEEKYRQKWSCIAFGKDDSNPDLYDLSIDLNQLEEEHAIDLIVATVQDPKFQPSTYSWQCAKNSELSYRLRALLIDLDPEIQIHCRDGNVEIHTKAYGPAKKKNRDMIQQRLEKIPDIHQLEIQMRDSLFQRYEGIMR